MNPPFPLLVVDDDEDIRGLLSDLLSQAGLPHNTVATLAAAQREVEARPPSAILLDLTLEDGDGLEFCTRIRRGGFRGGILMLTARGTPSDRIVGLEGGADDYLSKPFEPRELIARVRNMLRRVPEQDRPTGNSFRFACFGPWRLDLFHRRLVGQDERVVMLSTGEFDILQRMIAAPHVEQSRQALLPERRETVDFDRSLDNRVSRLRGKLALQPGGGDMIVTVRNRGFILAADVTYE